ncbi:hypothetical protein MMC06_004877 [Schaereria dolodes]|nr:hypothetical protein [Schaereria dolodes]
MLSAISRATVLALATSTALAKTITVSVGDGGKLLYVPSTVFADIGDEVQFEFYPQNHSVVQAAFDAPCQPISNNAFYSGYVPSQGGEASTSFVLTINDTTPLWFYCSQGKHCQNGMVGVINPPNSTTTNTQPAFAAGAKNASANVAPKTGVLGGVLQSNSSAPGGTTNSVTSSATGSAYGSATGTPTSSGAGSASGTGTSTAASATATTSKSAAGHMAVNGILGGLGFVVGMGLL